jgi:hypothetical protein
MSIQRKVLSIPVFSNEVIEGLESIISERSRGQRFLSHF